MPVTITLAETSPIGTDVHDLLGSSTKIKVSKKDMKLAKLAAYQSMIVKIK